MGILYHMLMEIYKSWRMNSNYFQSYQHDQQKEKNLLVWWVAHATQFLLVSSLVHQMWGIISLKIEIGYMISVIGDYKSLTIKVGD